MKLKSAKPEQYLEAHTLWYIKWRDEGYITPERRFILYNNKTMLQNIVRLRSSLAVSGINHIKGTFRLTSSSATAPLLQSFKYDAPWLHYSDNHSPPSIKNFINGSFEHDTTAASQDNKIPIYDPSTNNLLSYVPESTTSELNRAVQAAKDAYPSWSNTPVQNRQRLLLDYAHFLHRKDIREEIA